jgi:hypothetical protein
MASNRDHIMQTFDIALPELGFVAATRAMAGVGIGLLLSECFEAPDQRKAVGWTLLAIGVVTTLPIALTVIARRRRSPPAEPRLSRPGR